MSMITIREYAINHSITPQTVYKSIKKIPDELLKTHSTKKGGTLFIDDFLVSKLDEQRKENALGVVNPDLLLELAEKNNQIEQLKMTILELQSQILDQEKKSLEFHKLENQYNFMLEQKELSDKELKELRTDLEQERIRTAVAEQKSEDTEKVLDDVKTRLEATESRLEGIEKELDEARTEADSYVKSIFGFYRKK